MSVVYIGAGNGLTNAVAIGPLRTEQPFAWMVAKFIYRQRFAVRWDHYHPLPANYPMIAYADTGPTGPTVSGTFKLGFRNSVTAAINAPATAASIQAAINALPNIGTPPPVVSGDWTNGFVLTNFAASFAKVPWHKMLFVANMAGVSPPYTFSAHIPDHTQNRELIKFHQAPLASTGKLKGTYLVEETPRQERGSGIVTFERVYADVPDDWWEYPAYSYQCQRAQFYRIAWSGATGVMAQYYGPIVYRTFVALAEWTEPLIASVRHKYYMIPEGTKNIEKKIGAMIPYRVIHITDSFGREQVFVIGTWGVAEATSAERWKGDIYHVKDTFVNPFIPDGP